ncbi:hypothetical protein JCM8547_005434 [Rhodosporidiobolus lusitaniae]
MLFSPRFLASVASVGVAVASPIKRETSPTVDIKNGTVEGKFLNGFNQDAFLGIPFAQKPIGDLRLRKPRSLNTTYDGVYEAKEYSDFCAGVGYDNWPYTVSEDCLYLNVIRPAGVSSDAALPIGFWIHGGGYQMGGSGDMRYNASWIVERSVEMGKPIMVVSTNYRTAALGFLASQEVSDAGEQNLGLYDQRLALNWVQENIAAFGGDKTKVAIWGESAGGFAVGAQLLGYGLTSTPLFRAAIMESGTPALFTPAAPSTYQANFDAVVNGTGCSGASDKLACLRSITLETFNASASAFSWSPVVDGMLMPRSPSESLKLGEFVPVPLLLGANTDEGASFGGSGTNTTEEIVGKLAASYPFLSNDTVSALLEAYPDDPSLGSPFNTGDLVLPSGVQQKRYNAMAGDFSMHAGRRRLAEVYSQAGAPVYSYRFDQPPQNATVLSGVGHFVEIAYVYGVPTEYKTANTLGNRPGDAELVKEVQSQWISFIHDLDPNSGAVEGSPTWPEYSQNATNYVHRRHGSVVEQDDYRKEGIQIMIDAAF